MKSILVEFYDIERNMTIGFIEYLKINQIKKYKIKWRKIIFLKWQENNWKFKIRKQTQYTICMYKEKSENGKIRFSHPKT